MQGEKNQHDLTLADEEIHGPVDTITLAPYSALLSERPQIICFARRIEELTGYTADEILADRQLWVNIVHPADRQRVSAAFTQCKDRGTPFEIEYRVIHKDGSLRYVIDEGEPVFDDKGQITEIEGIITDVSEFNRLENLLLGEKSFGVAELRRAGKHILLNVAKARYTGSI